MNCRAFNGRLSRGFTLIELMIVVVLMGILAAVIVPEMRGSFEDALLKSTARRLVSAFNLAHSGAITQGQLHRIRFDKKNARYVIERPHREDEPGSGFIPIDGSAGLGQLDSRISFEIQKAPEQSSERTDAPPEGRAPASPSSGDTISFYPDSTADAAELMLRDREGFRVVLRINPITGRVEILDETGQ